MCVDKNADINNEKEDDSMAIAKPVNRAFTIRASKVKEFESKSNKSDIERIIKMASEFEKKNSENKQK